MGSTRSAAQRLVVVRKVGKMLPHTDSQIQAPTSIVEVPTHIREVPATTRPCPRCGVLDTPDLGPGEGPHYARLVCRHCTGFWQWLSQYNDTERLARKQQWQRDAMAQKPPTEPQLAYLRALGDPGPLPANRQEASDRLDACLRKRGKGVA